MVLRSGVASVAQRYTLKMDNFLVDQQLIPSSMHVDDLHIRIIL